VDHVRDRTGRRFVNMQPTPASTPDEDTRAEDSAGEPARPAQPRSDSRDLIAAPGPGQLRAVQRRWGLLPPRSAHIVRETAETRIELALGLDGGGSAEVTTGIGFFDHMLTLLAKHSLFDLRLAAQGDLQVDAHHTVEDVGICFGKALVQSLGDKAGIRRYGHFTLPMDETLVTAALDLGGRPFFVWHAEVPRQKLGGFDSELAEDFWQAVASNGLLNLHVLCHYGRNTHHIIEAVFKAVARALRQAVEIDPRAPGIPSTKGTLTA
jgi:imidazoleglycerol-phosphate dehydratase